MAFAEELIEEIECDFFVAKSREETKLADQIEREVELELHKSIQEELAGNLSPTCAQRLIDEC
jgi:hypothetical protein